ncbi:histidine phosphatase family protein, partial [Fusobacterium sp.]
LMDMQKRVINFLKSLDFSKTNVLVAHWGVINCILSHYMSGNLDTYWKFKVENGGIAVLEGNFDFCYLTKFI